MSANKNNSPTRWQNPNEARRTPPVDPAATPMPKAAKDAKPKPVPRDYIGPALVALGLKPDIKAGATTITANQSLLAAIIIAQALDRFSGKLIDAAAVSQYRRAP